MSAILFVPDNDESLTILRVLQGKKHLGQKLEKVKINMKLTKPHLQTENGKITGITNILKYLQPPPVQRRPAPVHHMDYDERAFRDIGRGNAKIAIPDDDDVDENIKVMKKKQYEDQYTRHMSRLENPQVPKRIPVEPEPDDYFESFEEKKADELDNYYKQIMESRGD